MKLIKPQYRIIEQESGLEGIYRNIELAARNCYKSEPVEGITSKDFVDRMIKSKHLSTLEHGTVYLKYDNSPISGRDELGDYSYKEPNPLKWLYHNSYSKVNIINNIWYVTTNYRVLVENNQLDNLQYLCEPTEFHERRITVKFTSNIHFYKDLTRHRHMSFAIESTRYCNYSRNKFGEELTFITPVWANLKEGYYGIEREMESSMYGRPIIKEGYLYSPNPVTSDEELEKLEFINDTNTPFIVSLNEAEQSYIRLINNGWQAQQAAEVLPQATKADIIVTGFISDWEHIFRLRTSIIAETGQPHPELSRLMNPLYEEFRNRKLIV